MTQNPPFTLRPRQTGRPVWKPVRLALLMGLLLLSPALSAAEYYEYIDEEGVKTFTDDQSLVPAGGAKTKVHKEKYDHLDEAERQRLLKLEEDALERQKQETREWLEQTRQQKEAEKKRQAEAERQKRIQALKTPVAIMGNLVLVPVTLMRAGKQMTVPLLLDTGASMTSINASLAEELNLDAGKKSAAIVAGGGILRTRIVRVDTLQVGPMKASPMTVMVLPDGGPARIYKGLLGQNFLGHFPYTLDYKNQVIQWTDPEPH